MPYPTHRPFFLVDNDTRDYALYDADQSYAKFNPELESAVRHMEGAILDRGGVIQVAFAKLPLFEQFDATCVSLMQDGNPMYHAEVWFGENVVQIGAGQRGIDLYSLPRKDGLWEVVRLPFADPCLAFRLAVDIVRRCHKEDVCYDDHLWKNLECGLCRALWVRDMADRWVCGDDYDEERPETWTNGVHCSQIVLLFLKRCVRHGALAPARDPLFFLNTYSHTCMPAQLRVLLDLMWGDRLVVETRDMNHVPKEVLKQWYGEGADA